MPRIRSIKPEFFSHEDLSSRSAHARLLAIGLLCLADCEGRLRWVPMQVHSQVFPWEASVNIESLLSELLVCDYCVHYEAEGKRYVQIKNFRKHQRLTGKEAQFKSRLPAPPEKPIKTLNESGESEGKHLGVSLGSSEKPLGTGEQGNRGTGEQITKNPGEATGETPKEKKTYSDDFEKFWLAFPGQRKTKKKDAYTRWKKAIKEVAAEVLIARAFEYATSHVGQSEFAVMPSVWLNAGMWEDAPEAWGPKDSQDKPIKQKVMQLDVLKLDASGRPA